jgi:hypothetical protein
MRITTSARAGRVPSWLVWSIAVASAFVGVAQAQNTAPTISGSPPTSWPVNTYYRWSPTASDRESTRRSLRFAIANKPSWLSFNIYSGQIYGTPTRTGTWSSIRLSVTDGTATTYLPTFSITVTSATANRAPVISGTPATSVAAGSTYSFRPTASDADGHTLGFSIQNRPAWATFSTSTGQLSGTPTTANIGTFSNIVISVSDGRVSTALPAFAVAVRATNVAPTISGTPAASAVTGSAYNFTPTAADGNGDALTFSIQNRPAWATFDASTGRLSGTPSSSHLGAYSNVIIAVSDGQVSRALPAFTVTVVSPVVVSTPGTATLNWTAPTVRTDNSTLTNLAGYRIAYGTSAAMLHYSVNLANPSLTTYVLQNLAPGTYYFVVRAFDSTGNESPLSNVTTGTVR